MSQSAPAPRALEDIAMDAAAALVQHIHEGAHPATARTQIITYALCAVTNAASDHFKGLKANERIEIAADLARCTIETVAHGASLTSKVSIDTARPVARDLLLANIRDRSTRLASKDLTLKHSGITPKPETDRT